MRKRSKEDFQEYFNIKTAEWRGYTLKALEDLNDELSEIRKEIQNTNKKIDTLNSRFLRLSVKVGAIGAVVAILVSIACQIIGFKVQLPWLPF